MLNILKEMLVAAVVFTAMSIVIYPSFASADAEETRELVYAGTISVTVVKGDTLEDIAATYCPYGLSVEEYVEDIKTRNGLPSGKIRIGQTLYLTEYAYEK